VKVLICIPTYNERDNVESLAGEIFARTGSRVDLLFIDDGSPDGTGALLNEMAARNPRVHVLHRSGKLGLATAYLAGFNWGLAQGFDWIMEMDADFSHDPAHLPAFLEAMASNSCDVICGSRYVPGGGVSNWSQGRLLLSRMGSVYANLWLRYPVADWTGGFNAWNRQCVQDMCLESLRTKGYAFQIELKFRALTLGKRLRELPITFRERRAGQSKMSGNIVKEALLAVALLRWKHESGTLFVVTRSRPIAR
jgi:dolichol-phosphate mannosyltransferase